MRNEMTSNNTVDGGAARRMDFRSDTVTHPTPAMRRAMADAEVGDDVYQDDPTTNRLEQLAAEMVGKEAALFVSSGTMGNQLALMSHTVKGQEAIVGADSHIFMHEVGAAAVLSSLNLRPLAFPDGVPDAAQIRGAIRSSDIHEPATGLICLENGLANGRVVPVSVMREVQEVGRAHGIPVHLDGARLFNAATALGVKASELAACVDSVQFCLSKGLCAPVGSMLCGDAAFIARARKYRKLLGGGMRQTGVLAAAGILAIEEMTQRLHEDHANARLLAELLNELPGVEVDLDAVQINMVFATFDWPDLAGLKSWLAERGAIIGQPDGQVVRFLTNNDVNDTDCRRLVALLEEYAAR
ncbi:MULTISPECIES: low-specificity L-threonine aldolase [unclassified Actinomyces]|uniref:low-specificity L-threonine aldolase n=1 Tax=unclassified Actinomyces TaxID=2609248 RepID=UPI001901C9BC|nr:MULTISPECIES: low-specificity L-threonine aldolase [unclassified Actinomyces]